MKNTTRKLNEKVVLFLSCLFLLGSPLRSQNIGDTITVPDKKLLPVMMGEQDPETMIQSYSSTNPEILLHRTNFQMENSLPGILPGLRIFRSSGFSTIQSAMSLRGNTPLIIVDGVPRADVNIPYSQIKSIAVIKDALGLAPLGMSTGGGVIYIETKRGTESKIQIDLTAQLSFNKELNRPKKLNSATYATLLNEALANDGRAPLYSAADIQKYKDGSSPLTHPDVDWYKTLLNNNSSQQQYNLNFSGGGDVARYFLDLNFFDQKGMVKEMKGLNNYSTNNYYQKYSLRNNIDVKLTAKTDLKTSIFGQLLRDNLPTGIQGLYSDMYYTPNNAYPVYVQGDSLGTSIYDGTNLLGKSNYSGYTRYTKTDFNFDVELNQRIGGALEGMYLQGRYSYNSSYRESLTRTKGYNAFYALENGDGTVDIIPRTSGTASFSKSSDYQRLNRLLYAELAVGYDFLVGSHSFKTKAIYSNTNYLLKDYLPLINEGISLKAQYDYDKRYLAEIAMSYMGMNQFRPGHRWGFFPSAGLGWNISKEKWFDVSFIDAMKIRTSFGKIGDNLTSQYYRDGFGYLPYYYDYQYYFRTSDNAYFGTTPTSVGTVIEAQLPYPTTWAKTYMFTLGTDISMFDNVLNVSVEYFNNKKTDILYYRNISNIIGVYTPGENIRKDRYQGLEFVASYNQSFNDFNINASFNTTITKTKLLYIDEPEKSYDYMRLTGQTIGQVLGYVSDGFYQSQEDIDNHAKVEGYSPIPGDLKYKDLNNDDIIDARDMKGIFNNRPVIDYGISLNLSWKGLDLSAQFSGVLNREIMFVDDAFLSTGNTSVYGPAVEANLNRWTPDNRNAAYPRLSAGTNPHNSANSTFWIKNGNYLRLNNVELGYTLLPKWANSMKLSQIKVFVNASNLWTVTGLKDRDPEMITYSNCPLWKTVSFGLNVKF